MEEQGQHKDNYDWATSAISSEDVKREVEQIMPTIDPQKVTLKEVFDILSQRINLPLSQAHKDAAKAAVDSWLDASEGEAQPPTLATQTAKSNDGRPEDIASTSTDAGGKPKSVVDRVESLLHSLREDEKISAHDVSSKLSISKKEANSALYKLKTAGRATLSDDKKPTWSASKAQKNVQQQQSKSSAQSGDAGNEEEQFIAELGGSKRAAVKLYQGKRFLDVRRVYGDKPTKQGIMLTQEQFQSLREAATSVDQALEELEPSEDA